MRRALPFLFAFLPALWAPAQDAPVLPDGRAVFAREACWQCHVHARDPAFPALSDARRAGPVIGAPGLPRSSAWQLAHLFDPRTTSAGSEMPAYAHLFAPNPRAAEVGAFLARFDTDGDGIATEAEYEAAGGADWEADLARLDAGNGVVSLADAAPVPTADALALARYLEEQEQALPLAGTPRAPPPAGGEPAVARGRELFLAHCAGCHGEQADGNGPAARFFPDHPPRNLRRGDYKFRSTVDPAPLDEDLFRTIRRGAGPSMPAWPQLADAQVWALVAYLKALHPYFLTQELHATERGGRRGVAFVQEGADVDDAAGAPLGDGSIRKGADARWWWHGGGEARPVQDGLEVETGGKTFVFRLGPAVYDWMEELRPQPLEIPEPPFAYSAESAEKGARVYVELQCANCHGPEGRGDGLSAATTRGNLGEVVLPTDYTRGARWLKGGADARSLVRSFLTGLHGTPMPSYATNFAAVTSAPPGAAPWHLAHYVMRQAGAE